MARYRVYFNVGWCSLDVQAEDRKEAITKVWQDLDELSHGAVEGLRLGSYTVSEEHTVDLGCAETKRPAAGAPAETALSVPDFPSMAAPPAARARQSFPPR